ncbi:MAG: glycosyltransferase [Candidatus Hodarchaeota archaeon]
MYLSSSLVLNMKNKIKIVHITSMAETGGLSKAVYTLIREQLKDPELKVGLLTMVSEGRKQKDLRNLGCEVLSVPLRRAFDIRYTSPIMRFLKRYEIHQHHILILPFVLASIFCCRKHRIYTSRGGYKMQREKIKIPLFRFLLNQFFHVFTANTKYAALVSAKRFKIPVKDFSIIYNGLDFSTIISKRPRSELRRSMKLDNNLVIGTASVLHKGKSVERLIRAAAMFKNPSFRVLIVGDGPVKEKLINEAKSLGINNRVIFTGMQIPPYDYIKAMDIFVFPSTSQSFSNNLVEAMSLEIPVIVFSDSGGALEHIQDGKIGFVVKNENELVQCIQKLAMDKQLRMKIGKAGSIFVREKYTLTKMTEGYKKIYLSA